MTFTGSYTDAHGETHDLPVAEKDLVVHDDQIGIDRQIYAGQHVPPELLDAYAKATGGDAPTASAGDAGSETHRGRSRKSADES